MPPRPHANVNGVRGTEASTTNTIKFLQPRQQYFRECCCRVMPFLNRTLSKPPSEATGIRSFLRFQKLAAQIRLRPLPFAHLPS